MLQGIARIGREKTIRTLAERLFVIEGANKAANLRMAERALLRANPSLARKDGFRAGAVVIVPSGLGLATRPRVQRPASDLEGVLLQTTERLHMSEAVARNGFAKSRQAADEAVGKLKDRAFLGRLKKASPEASKLASTAVKNIELRRAENDKREGDVTKAIEQAISEIDKLQRLVRRNN